MATGNQGYFEENESHNIEELKQQFLDKISDGRQPFFEEEQWTLLIENLLTASHFDLAEKAIDIADTQHPMSLEVSLCKANYLRIFMLFEQAMEVVAEAELYHSQDFDLLRLKARLYSDLNQIEPAIELLKRIISFSADAEESSEIEYQLAGLYNRSQNKTAFEHHLIQALLKNLENEALAYEITLDIPNLKKVIKEIDAVLDNNPYNKYAWFCKSVFLFEQGKTKKSNEALKFALAIDEKFTRAWFHLGIQQIENEEYKACIESFNKYLELEIEPKNREFALIQLGIAYENQDDCQTAIQTYQSILKLDDTCAEAYFGIGSCLYKLEKSFEAIHFIKKAIELFPDTSEYYRLLGNCEDEIGNIISAHEAFELSASLNSNNISVWLDWSESFFDQDNFQKAIETILEGIEENPDSPELMYRAFVYLIYDGQTSEAYNFLELALSLNFDKHEEIYEFFPDISTQKKLNKFITIHKK